MAASRMKFVIAGEDQASPVFAKVRRAIGELESSMAGAEAGLIRIADSSATQRAGKSLDGIGTSAKSAVSSLGALVGITSTGAAFYAFNSMMNDMAGLGRSSMAIGLNVEKLQELQGAYRRVGGDADGLTQNVRSLAEAMRNARIGKNDLGYSLAGQYGINLERLKDGTSDVTGALLRIADVYRATLKKSGPQAAQDLASAFGIGPELDPLLRLGSDGILRLMEETRATGVVMKEEATDGAIAYQKAMVELEDSVWGVANAIGNALKPALTEGATATSAWLKPWADNPELMWSIGKGAVWNWGEQQADWLNSLLGYEKSAAKKTPSLLGQFVFGDRPENRPLFDAGASNPTAGIPFDQLTREDFLAAAQRHPIPPSQLNVDIRLHGAPQGATVTTVTGQGPVEATARVESSMPAYGP